MDPNGNLLKTGKELYFQNEIDCLEYVSLVNMHGFWKKTEKEFDALAPTATTPGPELLRKIERIYIEDEEWEEWAEEDVDKGYECAIKFWDWATRLMKKIGPFVKELHIAFADISYEYEECFMSRNLKLKFLSEMSGWFPNLSALKITGNGLVYGNMNELRKYIQVVDKFQSPQVAYLEIYKEMSYNDFRDLAGKYVINYEKLTEVHVSVCQLATPGSKCVLEYVKTIHLSMYGMQICLDPLTYSKEFAEQLPNVKHLFIVQTMNDLASNLPEFVMGVHDILKLDTFGIDQTARVITNEKKIKICGIPVIRVDAASWVSVGTTLMVLDEIGTTPELLAFDKWDLAHFPNANTHEDIKEVIISRSKASFPDLSKLTLRSSKGEDETIKF